MIIATFSVNCAKESFKMDPDTDVILVLTMTYVINAIKMVCTEIENMNSSTLKIGNIGKLMICGLYLKPS